VVAALAAASRTFETAGSDKSIRMALIAITISGSLNVKPAPGAGPCGEGFGLLGNSYSSNRSRIFFPKPAMKMEKS
jgi:hypothetical protein